MSWARKAFTAMNQVDGNHVILLVDDDSGARDSLKFMLEVEGFRVHAYATADELLNENSLPGVSCLVTDYRMPGMNGLELIGRLRGRRLMTALVAIALVSLSSLALLLVVGGARGPSEMVHAVGYQFSRGSLQSVWSALHIEELQPLGQACVVGLVAGAVVKLRREPWIALDRVRMAALTAAILIGVQLAADYWAFLYVVWVIPLVGVSLLADPILTAEGARVPVRTAGSLKAPAATAG